MGLLAALLTAWLALPASALAAAAGEEAYSLPTGFLLGVGSSAYETEGAWDEDGKGESVWDHFLHARPGLANGDTACDSYHHYQEDVELVANMKLDVYRFSMSWPRIFPDGTIASLNNAGVNFYNNLINELVNKSIEPMVTLYHGDLPQALQDHGGGWAGNSSIQDAFDAYANFAFQTFGDRVKWWVTFNEPGRMCREGYETGRWPPGVRDPGVGVYQCAHNMILAHAKAYNSYLNYSGTQGGNVGISLDMTFASPLRPNNTEDAGAAVTAMVFSFAWIADAVTVGSYPPSMRQAVDANSQAEGRATSRLPTFTQEETAMLYLATDFLGVNHYSTVSATPGVPSRAGNVSFARDEAVIKAKEEDWAFGPGCSQSTPWGLRGALRWISQRYNNYPVFVTESGYFGTAAEGLDDDKRIAYLSRYLRATIEAESEDNAVILGFCVWSLLDNLEWTAGYCPKFGVTLVDFSDPALPRTPKKSSQFLLNITQTKQVPFYTFDGNS